MTQATGLGPQGGSFWLGRLVWATAFPVTSLSCLPKPRPLGALPLKQARGEGHSPQVRNRGHRGPGDERALNGMSLDGENTRVGVGGFELRGCGVV